MTTLSEVADQIEAEWYGAPRVRDFHRADTSNPQGVEMTIDEKTDTKRTRGTNGLGVSG